MQSDGLIVAKVSEIREGSVTRIIDFGEDKITYRFNGPIVPEPLKSHDFAALALIFLAMRSKRNLHIRGPVSQIMLSNLEEFQLAFCKWRPSQYVPIKITADVETTQVLSDARRAVIAYSGGVDANFTLVRHAARRAGRKSRDIVCAVLVHGFDISLNNIDLFKNASEAAAQSLSAFSVPLTTVETDWREKTSPDWEMEFGAGLAACLSQFTGKADIGLVGSDEDYGSLVLPWGSNPVTNHLLSGEFSIETDGAGFSRCEKVDLISTSPEIANELRVCWEGVESATGGNCGLCEKCLRTKLNFLANGKKPGSSLSSPHTLNNIRLMNARNDVQIAYLKDVLTTAKSNKISDPWVQALRFALMLSPIRNKLVGFHRRCRHSLRARFRTHWFNSKGTVAAMRIATKKVWAQRS